MIKTIFFDIDNTLLSFDGYVKQTMKEGFREFGICEYDENMFDTFTKVNNSLWHRIEEGTLTFDELIKIRWNNIFASLGVDFDGVEFEKYFRSRIFDNAIPIGGAYDLLGYLKGRYVLCTASNGPYAQQINRLKVGKMLDYFDFNFISEDIGHQKPTKEFFDECFRRMNAGRENAILPSESLIVGDSLTSDIKGGTDSGMKTCYFNFKSLPVPDNAAPDHVVESLEEIRFFV